MTETALDHAVAAMTAAPEEALPRLRFHERLAEAELFLLLGAPADGDRLDPELFDADGGRYVLAFDREARLAAFAGAPAHYAAVSGRTLAAMLAGRGIGIGLNLGTSAETLVSAETIDWLAGVLGARPAEAEERPREVRAPAGLPPALVEGLAVKLALAEGLARLAYLAGVTYAGGRRGHLLAFVDARPGAEEALARAVGEALAFSGIEAGTLDVAFLAASDPVSATLARVGLRFDIPQPAVPAAPPPPGSDPDRPPRLR
ncbi:MAG: SseB family protein [Rhodobacteraceae bacterium]|nr:SseB family protein [Paracoccaceae bacterium]